MPHTVSRDPTWSMHGRALQIRVQMAVIWVRASFREWTSVPEGLKGCQQPPDLHNPTYMLSYLEEDSHGPQSAARKKFYLLGT